MLAAIRSTTSRSSASTSWARRWLSPIAVRASSSAEATLEAVSMRTGSGSSSTGSMPSLSGSSTQIAWMP